MKAFITPGYIFTPGTSGVGTVNLYGIDRFDIKRLVAILNQTNGTVVYATGNPATGYTSLNGPTLTLSSDTSTHNSKDTLQIIYEDRSSEEQSSNDTLLRRIVKLLESSGNVDVANRQRVTVDAITAGTVTTVGTVTTITNAVPLGNLATIVGLDQRQFMDQSRINYSLGIRSKLV